MSYKIECKKLFAKVTQTSPIWPEPHETWIEIGLEDLPENICGTIMFRPLDPKIPDELADSELQGQLGAEDAKKEYKIKVLVPKLLANSLDAERTPKVAAPAGPLGWKFLGKGRTLSGADFAIYEVPAIRDKDGFTYVMDIPSRNVKYTAPKKRVDEMVSVFSDLAKSGSYTTITKFRRDLEDSAKGVDWGNTHHFQVFFYSLVMLDKVAILEEPTEGGKIVICN